MVLELFEDGLALISNIKSEKQFKIKAHHLKPYLTLEHPTLAYKVNMHILEAFEDVTLTSPSRHRSL